jgi:hypothetical protein
MRDCPGFKLTDTNETGEKHNVGGDEITFHISYPSTLNTGNNNGPKPSYLRRQTTIADRTSIGDFAEKVRLFRESVLTGAKTDNNEAYKEGKKNVNAAANEVISITGLAASTLKSVIESSKTETEKWLRSIYGQLSIHALLRLKCITSTMFP